MIGMQCVACGKVYRSRNGLYRHYNKHHLHVPGECYRCPPGPKDLFMRVVQVDAVPEQLPRRCELPGCHNYYRPVNNGPTRRFCCCKHKMMAIYRRGPGKDVKNPRCEGQADPWSTRMDNERRRLKWRAEQDEWDRKNAVRMAKHHWFEDALKEAVKQR